MIELGDKVKDTVTGLIGIATSRCIYLNGCDHIGIQPPADNKTGRVPSIVWVDVPQVEVYLFRKFTRVKSKDSKKIGGPATHPTDRAHPEYNNDEGVHLK